MAFETVQAMKESAADGWASSMGREGVELMDKRGGM